jgi:Uma2 family endonuclease
MFGTEQRELPAGLRRMHTDQVEAGGRRTDMATGERRASGLKIDYPTGDGKPMAETDLHRNDMTDVIETLKDRFAPEPMIYVSGNLLLFYVEGDRRKHVSPDVFVVRGVKNQDREHYLVWEEGKGPDVIIEITSKSTMREDKGKKRQIYREVLRVPEYFLFDPTQDYLKPPFQGFRLVKGEYLPIEPVAGRLPSVVLGLHLERDGTELRLYDPATGSRLPKRSEQAEMARQDAQAARQEVQAAQRSAQAAQRSAEAERQRTVAALAAQEQLQVEIERLRKEIHKLKDEG